MKKNPVTLQSVKYVKHYKYTVERLLKGHLEKRGRWLLADVQEILYQGDATPNLKTFSRIHESLKTLF